VGSFEHGVKTSSSIKFGKLLDPLTGCCFSRTRFMVYQDFRYKNFTKQKVVFWYCIYVKLNICF